MIYNEGRIRKNGEVLPIQCIRILLTQAPRHPDNLHYHEYTELLFGIAGNARVVLRNGSTDLTPGTLIVVHAGDVHTVCWSGEPSEYIVVKFLPQVLFSAEQTGAEYGYALTLIENASDLQFRFSPEELEGTGIPSILCQMMEEWESQRFGYELSLRADVTRVFLFLLRRWREASQWMKEGTQPADRAVMQAVLSYVGEHYTDLTERDVAAACGVSPAALSRLFSRVMKCSFPEYVTGVRLREAEKLLLTTDASVTDIALRVGFSSPAYFIARFRQAKGITPHRFRCETSARTAEKAEKIL